uniref:non-specific serine/threonine protein kinase n=1 Tax=Timema poppense TaxID=170557 RepID=A0A7R9CMK8_TIMPO|nr:unnamed protein product [Timema poppensis]
MIGVPGKKYDGPEVDVWSLGVILYTLVSGSLPFDGSTLRELRERVLRGKYRIPFYMSTDCENLLKKFLVLNPAKRASLENIMKDKWMNMGYEEEELKPYLEPEPDYKDLKRIEALVNMGYNRSDIEESLGNAKYDDVFATYLLLGRKSSDPESDGSRSGSSLSLRNIPPAVSLGNAQSPSHSHRGVHRSISATNAKPSRRASSGGETLRESQQQGTATGGGLLFHIFCYEMLLLITDRVGSLLVDDLWVVGSKVTFNWIGRQTLDGDWWPSEGSGSPGSGRVRPVLNN